MTNFIVCDDGAVDVELGYEVDCDVTDVCSVCDEMEEDLTAEAWERLPEGIPFLYVEMLRALSSRQMRSVSITV